METSIIEALVLPWWKIVIYVALSVIAVITVKFTVTFDLNTWLKERRETKKLKESEQIVSECAHIWTLYICSPYSRCDKCLVLISTAILLFAREHLETKPLVLGRTDLFMKPGSNEIGISSINRGKGAKQLAKTRPGSVPWPALQ